MQKVLGLFFILQFIFFQVFSQEKWMKKNGFEIPKHSIIVGYGHPKDTFNLPEGLYRPIFINFRTYYEYKSWKNVLPSNLKLYIFSEPQINPVMLYKEGKTKWDFEFGINNGIQSELVLTSKINFFMYVSSGPHFFSTQTKRQVRGFIFSNSLGSGLIFKLNEKLNLMTMFKIRHMSNANTMFPNHGINTWNYLLGLEF